MHRFARPRSKANRPPCQCDFVQVAATWVMNGGDPNNLPPCGNCYHTGGKDMQCTAYPGPYNDALYHQTMQRHDKTLPGPQKKGQKPLPATTLNSKWPGYTPAPRVPFGQDDSTLPPHFLENPMQYLAKPPVNRKKQKDNYNNSMYNQQQHAYQQQQPHPFQVPQHTAFGSVDPTTNNWSIAGSSPFSGYGQQTPQNGPSPQRFGLFGNQNGSQTPHGRGQPRDFGSRYGQQQPRYPQAPQPSSSPFGQYGYQQHNSPSPTTTGPSSAGQFNMQGHHFGQQQPQYPAPQFASSLLDQHRYRPQTGSGHPPNAGRSSRLLATQAAQDSATASPHPAPPTVLPGSYPAFQQPDYTGNDDQDKLLKDARPAGRSKRRRGLAGEYVDG